MGMGGVSETPSGHASTQIEVRRGLIPLARPACGSPGRGLDRASSAASQSLSLACRRTGHTRPVGSGGGRATRAPAARRGR
eukprot:scaffold133670_cov35-Tisochrysis_lutea.AAC.1